MSLCYHSMPLTKLCALVSHSLLLLISFVRAPFLASPRRAETFDENNERREDLIPRNISSRDRQLNTHSMSFRFMLQLCLIASENRKERELKRRETRAKNSRATTIFFCQVAETERTDGGSQTFPDLSHFSRLVLEETLAANGLISGVS